MTSLEGLPRPLEITAEWLTEKLRLNGFLENGAVASVQVAPHSNAHYRETWFLTVTYASGSQTLAPERMVYKRNDKGEGAGIREVMFYRNLMPQMKHPPVPVCIDADVVGQNGYVLLADMSDTHEQGHPALMTPQMLGRSMDALSAIQGFWWDHLQIYSETFLGLMHGFSEVALMPNIEAVRSQCEALSNVGLPAFLAREGDAFSKAWRAICEQVIFKWPDLFATRIEDSRALTLIHGDFTPGNQLIPFNEKNPLLIFDWEVCTRGIGAYDLAYFFQKAIPIDEVGGQIERDMISRYHNGLLQAGVTHYSLSDCFEDYRLAIIASLFYPIEKKLLLSLAQGIQMFETWHCAELLSGSAV